MSRNILKQTEASVSIILCQIYYLERENRGRHILADHFTFRVYQDKVVWASRPIHYRYIGQSWKEVEQCFLDKKYTISRAS